MDSTTVIHPFPARMAPEVARRSIELLTPGQRLLDPMCGSGTSIRAAVESGIEAVGVDIDPLAVLMTKVWSTKIDRSNLIEQGEAALEAANSLSGTPRLGWHDDETVAFIDYWFAEKQKAQLTKLVQAISVADPTYRDALKLALSKTIITKDSGASLARDVSHSRPHRSRTDNSYDVYKGFSRAVGQIGMRLKPGRIAAACRAVQGDSRDLPQLQSNSFDGVVTSPPYLNAIDYMRGHRLSLVWLGYGVKETTSVRSANVGAERQLPGGCDVSPYLTRVENRNLPDRYIGWVRRYVADAERVVREISRILRPGGFACLVVGNSFIRGWEIDNAQVFIDLLEDNGFRISSVVTRDIPSQSRYLPLPAGASSLASRMRTEVVLSGYHPF
jgi:DNA modification methylase